MLRENGVAFSIHSGMALKGLKTLFPLYFSCTLGLCCLLLFLLLEFSLIIRYVVEECS